jgi:hypothetical protein
MTLRKIINETVYDLEDQVECLQNNFPAWMVQPGFILKNNQVVYKINYVDDEEYSPKQSFYFLHIPKTSGMSIKVPLLHGFNQKRMYSNFLQYINDDEMIKCDFVSGHFALYPVELFKSFNKKLLTYTILREPTERFLSNFLYQNNNPTLDDLDYFMHDPKQNNVQHKHLTCTLNIKDLTPHYNLLCENKITYEEYKTRALSYNDLVMVYDNIDDALQNINYIEIVENQKDLSKLNNITSKKFGVYLPIKKPFENVGKNKDFINTIPKSMINTIKENQNLDYELYEKIKMGYYNE